MNRQGFTLIELLVVIAIIAILAALLLPVLGRAKKRAILTQCVSNLHQFEVAMNVYCGQFNDKLPIWQGGNTAWDMPDTVAQILLRAGMTKKTFYCPGTAPKYTDVENWAGVNGTGLSPSGQTTGPDSTLWGWGMNLAPPYHVVGYVMAFSGGGLSRTNQNTTLEGENALNADLTVFGYYGPSDRVLMADVTMNAGTAPRTPGYLHPENNYDNIPGGFTKNGAPYPHTSAHLEGRIPMGGNLGYKDGHVEWRDFHFMVPRCTVAYTFWW